MNEKVRGGKRMLSFGDDSGVADTKRLVREMQSGEQRSAVPAEGGRAASGEHET